MTRLHAREAGPRDHRTCPPPRVRAIGALAAVTVVAAACGPAPHKASAGLPPAPPVVTVSMREYAFDFDPSALHNGRVVFRMVNDGKLVHRMILVPLPADFPPIDVQLHGSTREIVNEAVAIRNLEPAGPGEAHGMTESFAFDLRPGRYAFLCLATDPDGVSHALKGMAREFQIP